MVNVLPLFPNIPFFPFQMIMGKLSIKILNWTHKDLTMNKMELPPYQINGPTFLFGMSQLKIPAFHFGT